MGSSYSCWAAASCPEDNYRDDDETEPCRCCGSLAETVVCEVCLNPLGCLDCYELETCAWCGADLEVKNAQG